MPRKLPQRDAVAAYQRKAKAIRRVGENARCAHCGENRPEALIPKSKPMTCAECQRQKNARKPTDNHHVFGKTNSPITVSILANDHRAQLSIDQYEWPEETLRNPEGCPLLRSAAFIRGFVDIVSYFMREQLLPVALLLESLSSFLVNNLGRRWWLKTDLQKFSPKGNSNETR